MAASSSGGRRQRPNAVGQEELRRLMREKQRETAAKKKKIDSPFARYNSLGNINCSLCNVPVKNELLWQTHVLGKQHKEKLAGLKDLKQAVPGPLLSSLKRKTADTDSLELKKVKGAGDHPQIVASGLPTDFFGKMEEAEITSSKDSKQCILLGDYEEEEEEEESVEKIKNNDCKSPLLSMVQNAALVNPQKAEAAAAALTSDSLDRAAATSLVSHSGSIQKAEIQEKIVERKENTAEALPEGFFDDPEVDAKTDVASIIVLRQLLSTVLSVLRHVRDLDPALGNRMEFTNSTKVRKVDAPKDQMDKEWDEFQKAMRQVNTISEAIVAEEDEEGRLDRQIGEIDEQIECFRRVEQLRDRQEVMKNKLKEAIKLRATHAKDDEDMGSDDEGELQDLLSQDWRAKGTSL